MDEIRKSHVLSMEVNLRVKRVNRVGEECDDFALGSPNIDRAHSHTSTSRIIFRPQWTTSSRLSLSDRP